MILALSTAECPQDHRRSREIQQIAICVDTDRRSVAGGTAVHALRGVDLTIGDGPTANLDSDTGEALLATMRGLNESHGTSFIFSTHER